ncbi:hypothetical protein [Pleurocapsa sp. CCALA 161]|nr:hypothetical protein [Pleurocapsa sp. CCALA 161]
MIRVLSFFKYFQVNYLTIKPENAIAMSKFICDPLIKLDNRSW